MPASFAASTLQSPTGAALRVYISRPAGEARAVVHVNHGMAEHAARYERFARHLARSGYGVVAHDHRGHGATTAPDAPLGVFGGRDGWTRVLADVGAVNAHARAQFPGVPLVCFGHSMGGIIGFDYCLTHPASVDAAAVWNTSFDTPFLLFVMDVILRCERLFKGSDVPSAIASRASFEAWNKRLAPNRTDFDWLSRDPAEVDKYIADPLCGFPVSVGAWLAVLRSIRNCARDRRLAVLPKMLPFHVLGGGADPVSDNGRAMARLGERLQRAGLRDVTVRINPDTRHEALNDINRDAVMAEFTAWLDARFG